MRGSRGDSLFSQSSECVHTAWKEGDISLDANNPHGKKCVFESRCLKSLKKTLHINAVLANHKHSVNAGHNIHICFCGKFLFVNYFNTYISVFPFHIFKIRNTFVNLMNLYVYSFYIHIQWEFLWSNLLLNITT